MRKCQLTQPVEQMSLEASAAEGKGKKPRSTPKGKAGMPKPGKQGPLTSHLPKAENEPESGSPIYNYDICSNEDVNTDKSKFKDDRRLCVRCPLYGQSYVGGMGRGG